jgi:predicted thioesterase
VELTVGGADTAPALGSGDLPVLATPRALALVEQATVAAVAPALDRAATTVGARVALDHLAATLAGAVVVARARLVAVEGRRLHFEVTVEEAGTVVARGQLERVVVDRERFLARVNAARLAVRPAEVAGGSTDADGAAAAARGARDD